MNETERLLKLQNAVKMMIADGKTPAYIDTFLAKQNSSPEEIKTINEYGAENIAKSIQAGQQIRESLPSNSLLSNMLTPEALKEAVACGIYSLEEALNATTARGYGWFNKKIGGNFDKRR